MKKANDQETRKVNGGRWQCDNCGKKTLTVGAMHLHLSAVHTAYSIAGHKTSNWVIIPNDQPMR